MTTVINIIIALVSVVASVAFLFAFGRAVQLLQDWHEWYHRAREVKNDSIVTPPGSVVGVWAEKGTGEASGRVFFWALVRKDGDNIECWFRINDGAWELRPRDGRYVVQTNTSSSVIPGFTSWLPREVQNRYCRELVTDYLGHASIVGV